MKKTRISDNIQLIIGMFAIAAVVLFINTSKVSGEPSALANAAKSFQSAIKGVLDLKLFGSEYFTVTKLFEFIGGLGLFLFGIKFMGEGLQLTAGKKIRKYITKFTDNAMKGFLLGLVITGILQSSSGTTALVVALVSAGLMTFRQSIAVTIGANIGTTITSVLIGLKIKYYLWMIIAIGGIWYMFTNKKHRRHIAQTILAFGILFLGMKYMGGAVKPLAKEAWFKTAVQDIGAGNSFLGLGLGTLLTMLVQSSSAFVGIVQSLHMEKVIPGAAAIPMVLGANIGTTITAILAAFGSSIYAKRTAVFHSFFNIFGALAFTILIVPFSTMVFKSVGGDQWSSALIPITHVTFNGIMAIIFLPLIPISEKVISKIIKSKNTSSDANKLIKLNYDIAETSPALALVSAKNALTSVIKLTNSQTNTVYSLFKTFDKKVVNEAEEFTLAIEQYTSDILAYLDDISEGQTNTEDQKVITNYTLLSRDIISISQINKQLKEMAIDMKSRKRSLSESAYKEMKVTFRLVIKITEDLITILEKGFKKSLYNELATDEMEMDRIITKYKKLQISRMKSGKATTADLTYLPEIMTSVNRLADHVKLAADYLVPEHAAKSADNKLINKLVEMAD